MFMKLSAIFALALTIPPLHADTPLKTIGDQLVGNCVGANSGGNSDMGTVAIQGEKHVWASAGTLADGRPVEYNGETQFEDDGDTRIDIGANVIDGVRSEFRDTYKRARE